jgi:peptide/nickel transport system substrate-binding protein
MKRRLLVVLSLALLTLLVAPAMAQDTNTLTIALQQEPDTMSPIYTNMWFASTVQDLILAPAWYIDDQLNAVPIIASEIPSAENGGISADGKTITIKLRDNAVWSDGEPITSADFVFTYKMIIDNGNTPNSRYPWDSKVASVEAPDPQTVVVTFNEPFAPWLALLFSVTTPPLPQHVLQSVFDADGTLDNADWNKNPTVTSGPYKFVSWESGSGLTFVRNENYFLDAPKIENIDIKIVPDDATVVASLVSGDADVGTFVAAGDTPALRDAGVNIVLVPSGYNEGLFFNVSPDLGHPALQDVNVRKALIMLVDRDKINQDLNLGLVSTGASFWQNTPYMNPDDKPIPYDPEGAKKLLDDAGWVDSNGNGTRDKDGKELVLRYVTNQRQVRKDIQAVIKQALEEAGVGVDIQNFDSDIFFGGYADGGPMSTGQYDIGEYSSSPNFPDPDTSHFLCSEIASADKPDGINDLFYCNPDLDKLFAQEASITDTAARIDVFHQIDKVLNDAVVWTSMWYDPDLWAINGRVSNTNVSGADPLWNMPNWTLSG